MSHQNLPSAPQAWIGTGGSAFMSITRRPQRAGFNSAVERASRGADAKEHEERIADQIP